MTDHSHVSDLRWDRWLAGELPPDEATEAIAHAESCATCGARMRELTAGREAFQLRPVALSFAPPRSVRRTRAFAGGFALAAVAVVAIVVFRRPADDPPGERPKGHAPNLVLAAGRAPDVIAVSTGDIVHPGDSLQAAYTSDRDGFGAVLALDGAGAANAYVPAGGDTMVELPAGVDRSFPASTVLDRVGGTERIVILWCQAARAIAPLLGELRATGDVAAPAGCHARRVVLDKREAP